jgi:hypothetical protein
VRDLCSSPDNVGLTKKKKKKKKKKNIARACNMFGQRRLACTILPGKYERKKPLERTRRRWDDNIQMDLEEVEWGVDWIDLVQDRDKRLAFVNKVKRREFLAQLRDC